MTRALLYCLQEKTSIKASLYLVNVCIDIWEKSMMTRAESPGFSGTPSAMIGPSRIDMFVSFTSSSINSLTATLSVIFELQPFKSQII